LNVTAASGGYVLNSTGVAPELSMPMFKKDAARSVCVGADMVP